MAIDGTNVNATLHYCFTAIEEWFALVANPRQIRGHVIGTSAQLRTVGPINAITLSTDFKSFFESVRSLGVTIDSIRSHSTPTLVCKSVCYHTRALCGSINASKIAWLMLSPEIENLPILAGLHWLPFSAHIEYKLALIIFK